MRRELSFATVPCINYDVKRLLGNWEEQRTVSAEQVKLDGGFGGCGPE